MNQYFNLKYKENEGTPKRINTNLSPYSNFFKEKEKEKDSFKKGKDEVSLLISNFPNECYKDVIIEFSKFGNIKNIFYDFCKYGDHMIIEYENPEITYRAAESFDDHFLKRYNFNMRIKINLLTEEEKLRFLERMLSSTENEYMNTSSFENSMKYSYSQNKPANQYNKGLIIIDQEKSNWKKFTDVFFNF